MKSEVIEEWSGFSSDFGGYYVKDQNMRIQINPSSVSICDLQDALKRGAECRVLFMQGKGREIGNYLDNRFGTDLRKAFDTLAAEFQDGESLEIGGRTERVCLHNETRPANRTFSPFALDRLKPLKSMPAKWTMPHIIKALANRQFSNLRCAGVYTDDYAYDDAANYNRGPVSDHLALIQDLVEQPSGWWASNKDQEIHFSCHHFRSYDFHFELQPVQAKQAQVEAQEEPQKIQLSKAAREVIEKAGQSIAEVAIITSRHELREHVNRYGIPNALDESEHGTDLFGSETAQLFVDDDTGKIVAYCPAARLLQEVSEATGNTKVLQDAYKALHPAWEAVNKEVPQEVAELIEKALDALGQGAADAPSHAHEAMIQVRAALPDKMFAERCGFDPAVIEALNSAIDEYEMAEEEEAHSPSPR